MCEQRSKLIKVSMGIVFLFVKCRAGRLVTTKIVDQIAHVVPAIPRIWGMHLLWCDRTTFPAYSGNLPLRSGVKRFCFIKPAKELRILKFPPRLSKQSGRTRIRCIDFTLNECRLSLAVISVTSIRLFLKNC